MEPKPSVHITGTGHAVPQRVLTNEDLSRIVDTSDEWIVSRTGIRRRHIAEDHETNSDFAAAACRMALADAGCDPGELDYIIIGTVTPDLIFPSVACLVQAKIGAGHAAALDLSAACSGFLFAMNAGTGLIKAGMARKVLVVGTEALSRITNWKDRSTCVLFGDGAGAALLEHADDREGGILSLYCHTDGRLAHLLNIPRGGSAEPATPEIIAAGDNKVHMKGNEIFKYAVRSMGDAARRVLAQAGVEPAHVELFIPHQANIRIIDACAARLEIDRARVFVTIEEYGNTSSSSIPIALDLARRQNRIQPGDHVLMAAFGGGLTWGAALVQF